HGDCYGFADTGVSTRDDSHLSLEQACALVGFLAMVRHRVHLRPDPGYFLFLLSKRRRRVHFFRIAFFLCIHDIRLSLNPQYWCPAWGYCPAPHALRLKRYPGAVRFRFLKNAYISRSWVRTKRKTPRSTRKSSISRCPFPRLPLQLFSPVGCSND